MVTEIVTEEDTEKMSVRLLFPTLLFKYDLIEEGILTSEYLDQLRQDMDAMRKKDPTGRKVSNAYTGWQSNDGCNQRPIWQKVIRVIKDKVNHEVLPFHHVDTSKIQLDMGNMWANINDKGAWNTPHRHNGCWYSGAFYVCAEGDEGDIIFTDKNEQVLSQSPINSKVTDHHRERPTSGTLLLFPSGLLHMVSPNITDKDRYSVAFNMNSIYLSNEFLIEPKVDGDYEKADNWNLFDVEGGYLKR